MAKRDAFWASHWNRKRAAAQQMREDGLVHVTQVESRLHVVVPYKEEFTHRAKELGGRWRTRSQVWSFPVAARRLLMELLREIYGEV